MYSMRTWDCPQEMERNYAAARHSWARQHAWLLLSFFPFPVGHPMSAGCTLLSPDIVQGPCEGPFPLLIKHYGAV